MTRRILSLSTTASLAACVLLAGVALADAPEFKGASSSTSEQLDCATGAKNFDPFSLAFLVDDLGGVADGERSIRCVTEVRDGKKGRKGVKVTLEGEILDTDGNTIQNLGTRRGRTNKPPGYRVIEFPVSTLVPDDFIVSVNGKTTSNKKITNSSTTCTVRNRKPCVPDNNTLCLLNDNRFKVDVDWRTSNSSGQGTVLNSSFDTGIFSFFNPNNQDLLVQLLEACANNDHFWVFAQAATNVEFDLTVTDTETGEIREYGSPLGQAFQAITDTSAFATCP